MSDDYSIRLLNVEKTFVGLETPAVESLTIDIHGGSVTGLVGPDGAGKTTLMRMLAGLLKPDSVQIRVMGHDPIADSVLPCRADLRIHATKIWPI
ncbi:hypothetical protein MASR2M36_38890 [Providencia sp.]